MSDNRYRIDRGAQQTLAAVLPTIPDLVEDWKAQVEEGEIDEQFRGIAVALGWITQRDSRVHRASAATPRPVRTRPSRASKPADDNELLPTDGGTMATVEEVGS